MKPSDDLEKAMETISFEEGARVSQEVEAAQSRAVARYLRGDQRGAYREMVVILRHYQKHNQDLPAPCENLFKCLVVSDVISESMTARRGLTPQPFKRFKRW
ncbi:MAG: hypothetical protein ACOY3I_00795 [Verrucomicrobiota bacterium]